MKIRKGQQLGRLVVSCALLLTAAGCGSGGGGGSGAPAATWYEDADGDGYTTGYIQVSVEQPEGYVAETTIVDLAAIDCDDTAAAVNPGATEICNGGDDDCDAATEDGSAEATYGDACDGADTDSCSEGTRGCVAGSMECSDVTSDDVELCDKLDNDCDGSVDEDLQRNAGGLGACAVNTERCSAGEWLANDEYVPVAELCDNLDNDCDDTVDEDFNLGSTCSAGVGECARSGVRICSADGSAICDAVAGQSSAEICDGKDNDCDDTADEDFTLGASCPVGVGECATTGMTACSGDGLSTICVGTPLSPSPEACDGKDNDCDGATDEGVATAFYADGDSDGYGNAADSVQACSAPAGYVSDAADCDDGDPAIHPDAVETTGNRVDEDCDGLTACDADAGSDQTVATGSGVMLDGSRSYVDPYLAPAAFSWSVVDGPDFPAMDPIPNPTFTTDSRTAGTYVIALTVTDGGGYEDTAYVSITSVAGNLPPIADAGPDQYVRVNSTVTLDGSGSYDPDGSVSLGYSWSAVSCPSGAAPTLDDPIGLTPSFTVPAEGDYVFSLVVTDVDGASSPADTVTVSATTAGNRNPVANAGRDIYKNTLDLVTLDGRGSYDPDNDPLAYEWATLSDGVTLSPPDSPTPAFTPPGTGTFSFSLVVCDSLNFCSDPDTVLVTIGNVTNWLNATLYGADFSGLILTGANFNGATLINCLFIGCNLSTTNFANSILIDSDYTDADLTGVNFNNADLSGADLNRSDLNRVNFSNANLSGVTNLGTASNLDTIIWSDTTCPDGTNSDSNGDTCLGHLL